VLAACLTTLLFSISVVCAGRSARILGGSEANFWRLALATGLLALWAHLFGQGLSGVSFPLFLMSGIIGVGSDVFLFQALPRIGSRLTLLIVQCFSAVSAATIEWLWLGTKLTGRQSVACATILIGVAVALVPGKHLELKMRTLMVGIFFGLLAALGNGSGAVLSRKAYAAAVAAHENIDGGTAGYQRLIGGLMVAGICLLVVKRRDIAAPVAFWPQKEKWRRAWAWVFVNSFAGQTLGVSCYQWALKTTSAGIVLAIIATTPLAVIPFSCWLENDKVEMRAVIGGVIAVAGAIFLIAAKG
jgi:drug/metabolite transporter (DMT)-like permease